jgi:Cu2+-exporting ATPase
LIFALGVALIWLQIDASKALPIAIAVLVVSCPCALSLATPAALAAASGHALARGLVLSRSDALESIASVTDVVFDKTGTLTEGSPGLIAIETLDSVGAWAATSHPDGQASTAWRGTPEQWLTIAAALELGQSHPLARSIRDAASSRRLDVPLATGVANHPGEGVSGVVDGRSFRLGRKGFVEHTPAGGACEEEIEIWLGLDGRAVARFRFTDPLRTESAAVVLGLRARGLAIHLLSGDRADRVAAVARTLAIDCLRAEASPDDKLAYVRALQGEGRRVLMVGDGINAAPVLAGADVSVAVGQASALAKISADVVLLGGRLGQLNELHALALDTRKVIRQNLSWAMLYNLLAIPLAAFGWVSAWMAALGMSLSSLLVAGNALRLLPRDRPPRQAAGQFPEQAGNSVKPAGAAETSRSPTRSAHGAPAAPSERADARAAELAR